MSTHGFDLKYNICFALYGNQVLMIQRNNHPWKSKWNGLGGHIEKDETPLQSVYREMLEEANLKLQDSLVTFNGIVTWDAVTKKDNCIPGMYAFTAKLKEKEFSLWSHNYKTPEGLIAWKELEWVYDKNNTQVADNVIVFLPKMLSSKKPMRYHCVFKNEKFSHLQITPITRKLTFLFSFNSN